MTGDERLAKVAEVLAGHRLTMTQPARLEPGHVWGCTCGGTGVCTDRPEGHHATHVTQALAPLLDEFRAEDEARALREAADKWQWGQWTALTPTVKAGSVIGAAQVVTDWLRDRAALAAAEPDAGER